MTDESGKCEPITVNIFDDVRREFVPGDIDPSQVTDIAEAATLHAGKAVAGGFKAFRVGLGPGKWAYVDAEDIEAVKAARAAAVKA